MLTALTITANIDEQGKKSTLTWTYPVMNLLAYAQQALPGMQAPEKGIGTKDDPYRPRLPEEWWYCAKPKGSGEHAQRFPNQTNGLAWISVGNRYIAIDPVSFYASDYGTGPSATPVLDKPTYPTLREAVATWKSADPRRSETELTGLLRALLKRDPAPGAPDALASLAAVLFVSEVARNHTAFITNLMALDLIEAGASLPMTDGRRRSWTWENAIWIAEACPNCAASGKVPCAPCGGHGSVQDDCGSCGGTGVFKAGVSCGACKGSGWFKGRTACRKCGATGVSRPPVSCRDCSGRGRIRTTCATCRGYGDLLCRQCNGVGSGTVYDEFAPKGIGDIVRTGADALQNGLLPMSHRGSAFGSAFDLSGTGVYEKPRGGQDELNKAPSALTVVRRKEATVIALWLQELLNRYGEIELTKVVVTDGSVTPQDEVPITVAVTATVQADDFARRTVDFDKVYDDVESLAHEGFEMSGGDTASQVKAAVRQAMLSGMQTRLAFFGYAFEPVTTRV